MLFSASVEEVLLRPLPYSHTIVSALPSPTTSPAPSQRAASVDTLLKAVASSTTTRLSELQNKLTAATSVSLESCKNVSFRYCTVRGVLVRGDRARALHVPYI